ncbi:MAG: dephospho-CoA kinase [Aeromicrobium sp.]|uniref:dephospho-CoA kinase n=1 Tax=Aeromicrobium sp. TaxID=1871063 RepID=UPI0039E6E298
MAAVRVGLTGGIGSGKSTVSALLRGHGADVIDYDQLAREVVEPGRSALAAIAEQFGPGVIAADGSLERPALGAIVFADEQARRDLEAITHPAIRDLAARREAAAGPEAIVVHDNPLLIEMGAHTACDVVVVVDLPVPQQIERLVRDRSMTPADAQARIDAQASREERAAVADVLIDNSGSLDDLTTAVERLWRSLEQTRASVS